MCRALLSPGEVSGGVLWHSRRAVDLLELVHREQEK